MYEHLRSFVTLQEQYHYHQFNVQLLMFRPEVLPLVMITAKQTNNSANCEWCAPVQNCRRRPYVFRCFDGCMLVIFMTVYCVRSLRTIYEIM